MTIEWRTIWNVLLTIQFGSEIYKYKYIWGQIDKDINLVAPGHVSPESIGL